MHTHVPHDTWGSRQGFNDAWPRCLELFRRYIFSFFVWFSLFGYCHRFSCPQQSCVAHFVWKATPARLSVSAPSLSLFHLPPVRKPGFVANSSFLAVRASAAYFAFTLHGGRRTRCHHDAFHARGGDKQIGPFEDHVVEDPGRGCGGAQFFSAFAHREQSFCVPAVSNRATGVPAVTSTHLSPRLPVASWRLGAS